MADPSAFELTMQDPPRMGEKLEDLSDLAGQTILAVFDNTDSGAVVFVTDTKCWLAIEAESGSSCDETAYIGVADRWSEKARLSDYVAPRDLLSAGCISLAVYVELQAEKDALAAANRDAEAKRLRAVLARLEGGAA